MSVDKIADLVSNMTIQLIQNTDKGDKRIRNDLSRLVDIKPNKVMTRKQFVFWIVKTMLLSGDGNAFVLPIIRQGKVVELKPLPSSKITIHSNDFDYSVDYQGKNYKSNELLHFAINADEEKAFLGTGYRASLKDITHNLKQARATQRAFLSSEYQPSLIVSVDSDSDLSDEEDRQQFEDKYLTRDKNKPWVIPEGMINIEQIKPLSLQDLAINDNFKLDKQAVASLIGVPTFVVGEGTYSKDEWNNFISTKILSIAQIIQQTLTSLITDDDQYFKFNYRSLLQYDIDEIGSLALNFANSGKMTGNEARAMIGIERLDDDQLDDLIALENFIPVAKLGDQKKLKGGE